MDKYEELDAENYLTTSQILYLPWPLLCLVPNIILVYLIVKNALQRSNFHFIILHCTIINLILLVPMIYLSAIPASYRTFSADGSVLSVEATFSIAPVIFTSLFIYDKYIKSKVVCMYSVILTWILIIILSVVLIICTTTEFFTICYVLLAIMLILKAISVWCLIIRSIMFCAHGSDEETCKLRIIIAASYIIIHCVMRLFLFGSGINYESTLRVITRWVLLVLTSGIGYINLVLIVCYNPPIKRHFRQLFQKQIQYSGIKFTKKSNITPPLTGTHCQFDTAAGQSILTETEKLKVNP